MNEKSHMIPRNLLSILIVLFLASASSSIDAAPDTPAGDSIPKAQGSGTTKDNKESFTWENNQAPAAPVMNNPIIITSKAQLGNHNSHSPTNPDPVPAGESPLYPAGNMHYLGPAGGITDSSDVIIDLRTEPGVITDPIRTWQARNVRIIGLKMKLEAPESGGPKQLKNFDGAGFLHFVNPYPRVTGGAALGITHSHVLYIEGCDIDCNGNNIDAIVPSPNHSQNNADQLMNRKIVLINSRIRGFRGHNIVKGIGEGLHCDAMQMQSGTANEIFIGNVDVETGHEGFVLNTVTDPASPIFAPAPGTLTIHNVSYDIDTRFIDEDPKMHQYPVALGTNVLPGNLRITNFEYRRLQGGDAESGVPYSGAHAILHVSIFNGTPGDYTYKYYVDPQHTDRDLFAWPGLKLIEGTIADKTLSANPMTKFAPSNYLGTGYKTGQKLY